MKTGLYETGFRNIVEKRTLAKIRSFLDEVANGTDDYRSVHNLTQEVQHQYEGRFLIELLQNAHDALYPSRDRTDEGRISVILSPDALYVANDGQPFQDSNFLKLTAFGQSDKDPEKSIGNKGIGFRSVLEVTEEPEIYSRASRENPEFDGYCFRFHPHTAWKFEEAIRQLLEGPGWPVSPFDPDVPLVDWTDSKKEVFRKQCLGHGRDWIFEELKYLSPYLLPLPAVITEDTIISRLKDEGYATVVRLPLKEHTFDKVLSAMSEVQHTAILFLERVGALFLDSGRTYKKILRKQRKLGDQLRGKFVSIETTSKEGTSRSTYLLWERTIGGEADPTGKKKIEGAVTELQGSWLGVQEAAVSLAVRTGERPEPGMYFIFLPTKVTTGCCTHINAPFYGDISRTKVDFSKRYNDLLLQTIAALSADVIKLSLVGNDLREARALVDLVAPLGGDKGKEEIWLSRLWKWLPLKTRYLKPAFSDKKEWKPLTDIRLLPAQAKDFRWLTPSFTRRHGTFALFNSGLEGREDSIRNLFRHLDLQSEPTEVEWKRTLEKAASSLKHREEDWDRFWSDVPKLFPNVESLRNCKILPGTDNRLHAAGDGSTIFFRPGTDPSDEDELDEEKMRGIPEGLSRRVAFLHSAIRVYEQKDKSRTTTSAHKYLSKGLVEKFETNSVLKAIAKEYRNFPLPLETTSCREVITWALNFVSEQMERRRQVVPRALGDLPAPCIGGWYPVRETSFGPGWEGTLGEYARDYLTAVGCHDQLDRLLLPPNHDLWGRNTSGYLNLLREAGVFNGLRPLIIEPRNWDSTFLASSGTDVPLPHKAPPRFHAAFWKSYIQIAGKQISVQYQKSREHRAGAFFIFPGIEEFEKLDAEMAEKLCQLLLGSIVEWDAGLRNWRNMEVKPVEGVYPAGECESPLFFWLKKQKWLSCHEEKERFSPEDRWFIPHQPGSQFWHYRHLGVVPQELAKQINATPKLRSLLELFGMPVYDPEQKTGNPRLLNDLAGALENKKEQIANRDIFLGQVRTAWKCFYPTMQYGLPGKIIVRTNVGLESAAPNDYKPIILQDTRDDYLVTDSDPVAELPVAQVDRLRDWFKTTYGSGVRFASECRQEVLSGILPYAGVGELFCESSLKWTIPLLLAILADYGPSAKGTQTDTFYKVSVRLRTCKIHWNDDIAIRIHRGTEVLKTVPVKTFWSPRHSALLAAKQCAENPALLSATFGKMMERGDLEVPIKLVLSRFRGVEEPGREEILEALWQLHIDKSRFGNVTQTLIGDIEAKKSLLKPALLMYQLELYLAKLEKAESEDELRVVLTTAGLDEADVQKLIEAASAAISPRHFGQILFQHDPKHFELDAWNHVLRKAGQDPVPNVEALEQFRTHLDSARTALFSVLCRISRSGTPNVPFKEMMEKVLEITCPEDLVWKYWEVPFQAAMIPAADLLRSMGASEDEVDAVQLSSSIAELASKLEKLGLDPKNDPVIVHGKNTSMCRSLLEELRKIAVTWCSKNGIEPRGWDFVDTRVRVLLCLDDSAFLKELSQEECFSMLSKRLPGHSAQKLFRDQLEKAATPGELMSMLGYTEKDIKGSGALLEAMLKEERVRKRMVNIAGIDFDPVGNNMEDLWDHITGGIGEEDIPVLSPEDIVLLNAIPDSGWKGSGGSGGGGGKNTKALTEGMKRLIGTAGEMHAFKALQKKYGEEIVHAGCWKSKFSLMAFPGNPCANDDLGYDFELVIDGLKYLIEVKSSEGEDEFFKLGPTEVKKAIDVAGSRKTKYRILRVTSALSSMPGFYFLPNPFEKKYAGMFDVRRTDANVRYERSMVLQDPD